MYKLTFWSVPEDLDSQYLEPHDFIHFKNFNGMYKVKGYYIIGYYFDVTTQHDCAGIDGCDVSILQIPVL